MYGGVPTVWRASMLSSEDDSGVLPMSTACSRARPKSRILACPSGATTMFAGFRSRWMTPTPWACASASDSCSAMSRTCIGAGGACRICAESVAPFTYSMTMCTPSSDSRTSYTAAMWGWLRRAAARASRRRRRRRSAASEPAVPLRVFSATRRWRRVSSARKTSPLAPAPSRSRMRYGPTVERAIPGSSFRLESRRSLAQMIQRQTKTGRPWGAPLKCHRIRAVARWLLRPSAAEEDAAERPDRGQERGRHQEQVAVLADRAAEADGRRPPPKPGRGATAARPAPWPPWPP